MTDQPATPAAAPALDLAVDTPPVLTDIQQSRVAALDVARDILASADASPGFGRSGAKPAPAVSELLEVADYVLTGVRVDFTFDENAVRSPVVFGLTGDLDEGMLAQLNALATRAEQPAPVDDLEPASVTPHDVADGGPVVPVQPTVADAETRVPPTAPPAS